MSELPGSGNEASWTSVATAISPIKRDNRALDINPRRVIVTWPGNHARGQTGSADDRAVAVCSRGPGPADFSVRRPSSVREPVLGSFDQPASRRHAVDRWRADYELRAGLSSLSC